MPALNTTKGPLISVILPYYNPMFKLFIEAIESLLSQSYKKWECIIINDGSRVESKNALEEYITSLNDKRFLVLHLDKNSGPSVARNHGIKNAKGEVFTFLDADDLLFPWLYNETIKNLNKNPECLIFSGPYLYYTRFGGIKNICSFKHAYDLLEGKETPNALLEQIKESKHHMFPQLFIRKSAISRIKFDAALSIGEDDDLRFQIMDNEELINKTEISTVPGYIYRIYSSPSRLSYRYDLRFGAIEKIKSKYNLKSSLATRTITSWEKNVDHWRLTKVLDNYMKNNSVIIYLKGAFSVSKTIKDKLKSIKTLITTLITWRVLLPVFAVDLRYLLFISGKLGNKYSKFKKIYLEYLQTCSDDETLYYAKKTYNRIF